MKAKNIIFAALFLVCSQFVLAQKQVLNVIYIGDSITQGVQLDDPSTQAPPATASKYLQAQPGIAAVNFSNQGHSGFTSVDFSVTGETFKRAEQAADALKSKPGILAFSIMLGTNDSAITGPNGAPVSAEAYFANMKAITDRLLKDYPGCRIVIQHPTWYSTNTYNGAKYLAEGLHRLESYFPMIKKLIRGYTKTNPGQVFLGDMEAFGYFKKNHTTLMIPENGHEGTFYLHPNKQGAVVLGQFWAKAIYRDVFHQSK
ncbi:MAG TPA: GDSL-type esterase/lipase family protein [Mucilaginibacter sp.]|nr:GDSL-type esterase/lipase family protein [Mucilaginibacter sp.]